MSRTRDEQPAARVSFRTHFTDPPHQKGKHLFYCLVNVARTTKFGEHCVLIACADIVFWMIYSWRREKYGVISSILSLTLSILSML